jgi:hypothetical protein
MIEPTKDASDSSIASSTDGFAKWMLDAFNRAGFCLMASIGHRAGLFDVMRDMPPATSAEIAARAGLNERYVREWLGAMTASQVVRVTGLEKTRTLYAARGARGIAHPGGWR